MATLKARIKIRSATAAQWASANPVLLAGEIVLETDTKIIRAGDGTTAFNLLPQIKSQALLDAIYQPKNASLTSLAALGTAAGKIAYTTGVNAWAEASITSAGLALIDDADAAAQRETLLLGTVTSLAEAVTDLSAITRSGWNRFAAAQTANAPFATGAGMVLTIFYDGSAAVQLVWGHNKGESDTGQWIRWRASSAWGGWVRLYGSQSEIRAFAFGEGQSWQDVTAARLAGTNYQNTTGRPIAVSITTGSTTANTALYLGVAAPANILIAATGTGSTLRIMSHQAVVPAGHYYRFEGAAPATWAELR